MSDLGQVIKQIEGIEASLTAFQEKAGDEIKAAGSVSTETKNAIDKIGEQQRELADRLLEIEQKGGANIQTNGFTTIGKQFTDSDSYKNFIGGNTQKARFEVQANTSTGSDVTVAPDRKAGVVAGAFQPLRIEQLYTSLPTSSNAIEFTKEATFVNNAAETAEGVLKPETDITFSLVNMPVSTVAHWTKISKQLAEDNAALAAYINTRMSYGVDKRVDTQLVVGNGTAPNLSGMLDTGNFTAHGYADADLGSVLKKLVLIRKVIGDMEAAGYMPNGIVLNPADVATIETEIFTTASGLIRFDYGSDGIPRLFGRPVASAVGMTADQFAVGDFNAAGTIHNRQGVTVEMSDSDDTNFQQNLITVRAERRLALATEVPAAVRAGDLTPV